MVEEYIGRELAKKVFLNGKHSIKWAIESGAKTFGDAFVLILDEIPAADVREVKHGKWETETLDSGKFWANYCSNCDYYLPYGLEWKPSYCPNCGANMEES